MLIISKSEITRDIYGCMRVVLPGKSSHSVASQPIRPNPIVSIVRGLVTMPLLHITPPRLHTHSSFFSPAAPLFVPVSLQLVHAVTFFPGHVIFYFLPQKISCSQKLLQIRSIAAYSSEFRVKHDSGH